MSHGLAKLFEVAEPERQCRLREFRMAALLWLGPRHPLMLALADAIADPDAISGAVAQIDALPAIPKRRVLAALASVL